MAFEPMHVANNILARSARDGAPVTPMRLQRLLWFTACEYAKATGKPLTGEQFEPWKYGPVLRSLHEKFRCYADTPITLYAKDAKGRIDIADEEHDRVLAAVLDVVWEKTLPLSNRTLNEITSWPGSLWFEATEAGDHHISNDLLAGDTSYTSMLGLDEETVSRPDRSTATRSMLVEAAGAAAGILGGLFIISVMNDPVARIIAVGPIALGLAQLWNLTRTLAGIIRRRRREPGTVVHLEPAGEVQAGSEAEASGQRAA